MIRSPLSSIPGGSLPFTRSLLVTGNGTHSTAILAQDTRELLDHLRWSKCHVVGLSMGGMIAQELALLIPERISSLTLGSC